jgi:Zn-dependent peptidase ImmA (M78 family)
MPKADRYNPWLDAARRYPDIHIEWHDIAPAHALWSRDHDVILIDETSTRAERRCALAHEIAHMDVDDTLTDMCWFATRQENAADTLAARRLVCLDELASVLRWCDDPREVAAELEVTLAVLKLRGATLHPAERGALRAVLASRDCVA